MPLNFHAKNSVKKCFWPSYQSTRLSRLHLNHANLFQGPILLKTSLKAWKQESRAFQYTPTRVFNLHKTEAATLSDCRQNSVQEPLCSRMVSQKFEWILWNTNHSSTLSRLWQFTSSTHPIFWFYSMKLIEWRGKEPNPCKLPKCLGIKSVLWIKNFFM